MSLERGEVWRDILVDVWLASEACGGTCARMGWLETTKRWSERFGGKRLKIFAGSSFVNLTAAMR